MRRPNACQQLTCKRQVGDTLHFVNKDDDTFADVLKNNFDIKLDEPLPIAEE